MTSVIPFFVLPVFLYQGLTETCGGLSIQDLDDLRSGIAGVPLPSNEVKLESCPEINDKLGKPYLISDREDHEGNPILGRGKQSKLGIVWIVVYIYIYIHIYRSAYFCCLPILSLSNTGEILVRGYNIAAGYYMMPDMTKQEGLGSGNWFHTGDVGQFMSDGSIRIVDRKKNLVKLKGGEYISIETMEGAYGNSKFVDAVQGGICCYGDGDMDRPIALMQLCKIATMSWAKENGIAGDFDKIMKSQELYNAVMLDLNNEGKKSRLSHLERIVTVVLIAEPWTTENGCLTAANKIQRKTVISIHQKDFEEAKRKAIF